MLHWTIISATCRQLRPRASNMGRRSRRTLRQDRDMQAPRDFSMYGAVDLGARQAAAQRRQQAARAAEAAGRWRRRRDSRIGVRDRGDRRDLQHRRRAPVADDAGDRGPVGRVVRSVQAAQPGAREAGQRGGRRPGCSPRSTSTPTRRLAPGVPGAVDPDGRGDHRRPDGGRVPRRDARGPGHAVAHPGPRGGGPDRASRPASQRARRARRGGRGRRRPAACASPRPGTRWRPAISTRAARALEKALVDAPADPLAKSWLAQVNLMRRVSVRRPGDRRAGRPPLTRRTSTRSC